ncbi:MAG: carbonic anhydrase [Bacillota bacterium]|jgi:carbonic anhydrase
MKQELQNIVDSMLKKNESFITREQNLTPLTADIRKDTTINGQHPYAVVITCSDSRTPPEHIFSAGIGELFVIRTAGNVVSDFELGSIEYGAEHVGAKIVMVLGHTYCGAIGAAIDGHAEGHIKSIVTEIAQAIGTETDPRKCELLNTLYTARKLLEKSIILADLVQEEKIAIVSAMYDTETGIVKLID